MKTRQAIILGQPEHWHTMELCSAAPKSLSVSVKDFQSLETSIGEKRERTTIGDVCLEAGDQLVVRQMPKGSLESVIFRMDVLRAMEHNGIHVTNPALALETAIDKYLCSSLLRRSGLLVPATHVSQSAEAALAGFEHLGSNVIVKPIFGGQGRGLIRICDIDHAARVFQSLQQLGSVIYQQQWIDHRGWDIRLLVVGDKTWSVKRHGHGDWRNNTAAGAICSPYHPKVEIVEMALRAAKITGTTVAAVDLMLDRDDKCYVIEVNGVPGWRGLQNCLQIDIAREIWAFLMKN